MSTGSLRQGVIMDLFHIDFRVVLNNASAMHLGIARVVSMTSCYPGDTEMHCRCIVSNHVEIIEKKVYCLNFLLSLILYNKVMVVGHRKT